MIHFAALDPVAEALRALQPTWTLDGAPPRGEPGVSPPIPLGLHFEESWAKGQRWAKEAIERPRSLPVDNDMARMPLILALEDGEGAAFANWIDALDRLPLAYLQGQVVERIVVRKLGDGGRGGDLRGWERVFWRGARAYAQTWLSSWRTEITAYREVREAAIVRAWRTVRKARAG